MENVKWLWGKTWIIHKCGVLPSSRICLTFLWSTKSNINYIQTIYETPWNTFFFTLLLSFWFRIQRLRQNGILHLQGLTYWHSIDKCLNLKIDRSKNSKLTLYDLASAFFILWLGCSLSVFLFIIKLVLRTRSLRLQRPIVVWLLSSTYKEGGGILLFYLPKKFTPNRFTKHRTRTVRKSGAAAAPLATLYSTPMRS